MAALSLVAGCATEMTPERLAARNVRATPALAQCEPGQQQLGVGDVQSSYDLSDYAERVAPEHARVRGHNRPFPDVAGAQVVLRMYASGDPHQQVYTDTSSIVWKDADGVWRAHAVDYRPNHFPSPRPPGEPQYTPEEYEDLRREITSGPLSEEQADRLERALADPCLELQPDFVPMNAPDACMGGISGGVIEITRNGATRRIADGCARWAAGTLMRVVLYPRLAE